MRAKLDGCDTPLNWLHKEMRALYVPGTQCVEKVFDLVHLWKTQSTFCV